ncbi:MAG TPA: right-handed parallel beta-helix repeat-containing protein [Lentimicrobium sp.]|nr:right-handed parallel beta-helix repeat-containing protein [Lentimicrobium sp.]
MIRSLSKLMSLVLVIVLFTVTPASAEFLNGVLTEDKTLSPSGNDYIVIEDYIIPEGVTLTILPGTRIYFYSGKSIFVNKGTIKAEGTNANPIVFDVYDPLGTNESTWNSLHFINANTEIDSLGQYINGCHLNNVRLLRANSGLMLSDSSFIKAENVFIQNGKYQGEGINLLTHSRLMIDQSVIKKCNTGISLNDSSALIAKNLTIENGNHEGYGIKLQTGSFIEISESAIQMCNTGIFIDDSDGNLITSCQISNCYMGIYFAYDCISRYNRIENNNLSYNLNVGIFVSKGYSGVQHNYIQSNTISYNQIGMHIGNGGINDQGFNIISGNSIQNNVDIGIRLSQDADTIYNNLIENNGLGLMLYRAAANHIRNNIIKTSEASGIFITEKSDNNLVEYNNIFDNQHSIKIGLIEDSIPSSSNTVRYNYTSSRDESFIIESGPGQIVENNTILSNSDTATFKNRSVFDIAAYNNYWGSSDTLVINGIISDKFDNVKWGEVLYKPFNAAPDPQVPISQPQFAVKRLVNNQVLVSWLNNKESDLAGYKLYYGNPQTIIDNSLKTTVMLPEADISEPVRVTAYDDMADGNNDQFEGHESVFTFAVAGPWAGNDNSVCSGSNFSTETSTAFEYQSLHWSTTGDGTFQDVSALHTFYMPGFNDKAFGEVNLILHMTTLSGLSLTDTINIKILEYFVLNTGNDTVITEGSSYFIQNVKALNFTELMWNTSGDGTFDKADTLYTTYTPGQNDIEKGWVNLILTISSGCGSLSDDFILTIIPGYDISGTVKRNHIALSGARILAYNITDEASRAITTVTTDPGGKFLLADVSEGDYYIFAVPDPALSEDYMPTYYATRYKWQDAYLMKMDKDVYDVDIDLQPIESKLPAGEGSISGVYNYEGELPSDFQIYNQNWFEGTPGSPFVMQSGEISPAGNHVILLMNADLSRIIGWTLSGLDGTFDFQELPFGAYRLWGEKAGFENKLSDIIYVTPDNKDITGVELTVDMQGKKIEAHAPALILSNALVYPNPSTGYFNISGKEFEALSNVEIELINEKGMSVLKMPLQRTSGSGFGPIITVGLSRGIYMCIISTATGIKKMQKISIN